MMDHMVSRDRDSEVDLESGGTTTSEEDVKYEPRLSFRQARKSSDRVWDGYVGMDRSTNGDCGASAFDEISSSVDVLAESTENMTERMSEVSEHTMGVLESKRVKEKRKKANSKKPPRPPRGPSLDAADQKMVKEISELAMLKRARVERMKAMKKKKAAKAASPNSNVCAMIITIIFCLIIIFQGIYSRGGSPEVNSGESTKSEVLTSGRRLISVQYFKNISPRGSDGSGSSAPESMHMTRPLNDLPPESMHMTRPLNNLPTR